MFENTYKNKKVFLTGHTGFKGSWLSLWLKSMGADVLGYSLPPETNPSMFSVLNLDKQINSVFGDILDTIKLEEVMNEFKPDVVFHLAAQPLVRKSYFEPVLTYQTNVIGTLNVLEAARKTGSVEAFVNITTDKCYENKEQPIPYKEDDPMGGYDMYSSSKACAEILSSSYRRSFLENGFKLATVRAGNVIGGGDWAKDRIIPDCIRAINSNTPIEIRNPNAVRPWQHVLEPLGGYLLVGEKLLKEGKEYAQSFNFGPEEADTLRVIDIVKNVIKTYEKGEFVLNETSTLHEANLLMLDINKAKEVLGWAPVYSVEEAITKTVEWYKSFYNNEDILEFSLKQIKEFNNSLTVRNS